MLHMWRRHHRCRLRLCWRWLQCGETTCTGAMCGDQHLGRVFGEEWSRCGWHFSPPTPCGRLFLLLRRCLFRSSGGKWWEIWCRWGWRCCSIIHRDARLNCCHTVHIDAAGCGCRQGWLLHRFRAAAAAAATRGGIVHGNADTRRRWWCSGTHCGCATFLARLSTAGADFETSHRGILLGGDHFGGTFAGGGGNPRGGHRW